MSDLIEFNRILTTEFDLSWLSHGLQCLESPTALCEENESEKGKRCFGITVFSTFYLVNSQKGTPITPGIPWWHFKNHLHGGKRGGGQNFSETRPGKVPFTSPLYYEVKWGTKFKSPELVTRPMCLPEHAPTHGTITRKDLCVVLTGTRCFEHSHLQIQDDLWISKIHFSWLLIPKKKSMYWVSWQTFFLTMTQKKKIGQIRVWHE